MDLPPATSVPPAPPADAPPGSPRRLWLAVGASVALVAVAAVGMWLGLGQASTSNPVQRRTVKVGLLAPLTGNNIALANGVHRAIQLARQDLDLQNVDLQVVERDSNCDADTAEAAMKDLVEQQGVAAVIGDHCSRSTLAALPLATQHHVVMISPAATSPQLSGASPYFFRTAPTDLQQGEYAAQLIRDHQFARAAVLHDDDVYGLELGKAFASNFTKHGGIVAANEVFGAEGVDINTQVDRIRAAKPDVVYIVSTSSTSAKAILLRLRSVGVGAALYGSDALQNQSVIDAAASAAEGLTITALSDGNAAYRSHYQAAFHDQPARYSAQTYDAFSALARAIAAGAVTGDDIRARLTTLDFTGVTSQVKFGPTGDITPGTYQVVTVKDGKFVPSH